MGCCKSILFLQAIYFHNFYEKDKFAKINRHESVYTKCQLFLYYSAVLQYAKINRCENVIKGKNETRMMFIKHYAPNRCLCIKVAKSTMCN